jgi:hypothetical protein
VKVKVPGLPFEGLKINGTTPGQCLAVDVNGNAVGQGCAGASNPGANGAVATSLIAGADIGAKINSAWTLCGGTSANPIPGCTVELDGKPYTVTTPIIVPNASSAPYVTAPILDCHGSVLTYTGTGDVLTVLGETASGGTGEIRNCLFSATAATIHIWSRPYFKMENVTTNLGAAGIVLINDYAHGGPAFTEEQHFDHMEWITQSANGCGISMVQDPSIYGSGVGSFFYNSYEGHWDGENTGTAAICTVSNAGGAAPAVATFGTSFRINVNTGPYANQSVFNLGQGTAMTRGFAFVAGENTGGGTPLYDVTIAGQGTYFDEYGSMQATGGYVHNFNGASADSINFRSGLQNVTTDLASGPGTRQLSSEPGGINPGRQCETDNVSGTMLFILAAYDPTPDCFFEIAFKPSGGASVSTLYTDGPNHNVGIGPGFSPTTPPTDQLDVNGRVKARTGLDLPFLSNSTAAICNSSGGLTNAGCAGGISTNDLALSFPATRNLFDPSRAVLWNSTTTGPIYDSYTNTIRLEGCCNSWSGLIPIAPNQTYTISGQPVVNNSTTLGGVFFDSSQTPIPSSFFPSTATFPLTLTAPANAAYIGFPISYNNNVNGHGCIPGETNPSNCVYFNLPSPLQSVMLTPGSTAPNSYVPFSLLPSPTMSIQGAMTPNYFSPWNGKTVSIIGDSYCYGDVWQQALAAYHNLKIKLQDCRVGRPFNYATECYGGSWTGTNTGTTNVTSVGTGCTTVSTAGSPYLYARSSQVNNGTSGNTFAQDLAGSDLILVELGTNDNFDPALGTIADGPTVASTYGYLQAFEQGLHSIIPATTKVVFLTPIQVSSTASNRAAMMAPITAAIQAVASTYGDTVIDNLHNSGFNLVNDATLLQSDGIHPLATPVFTNGPTGFQIFSRYPTLQLNSIPPMN